MGEGHRTLASARRAAADCRACHLYKRATQTVFGEGPSEAEVMMVGEQPGDAEDLAGHPFVGPAGQLLDRALVAGGGAGGRGFRAQPRRGVRWGARADARGRPAAAT